MIDGEVSAEAVADAGSMPAEVVENASPPPVEGAAPSEAPAQTEDEMLNAIYSAHNPKRGTDGKFASDKPADAAPSGDPAANEVTETPDQPQDKAPEQAQPAIEAPNSWSADMKAKWPSLPPEVQQTIAARESEAHQQISRMGQELASVKPLAQLATQYQPVFDHHGIQTVDGIARLLDLQVQMDSDPAGTVARIAQAYNVDLASLVNPQAADQGPVDPQVAALNGKIQQLEHQLSEVIGSTKAHERRQQEAVARSAADEVVTWSKGKEHFNDENVKSLMAKFVFEGKTLDEAYDMAIYAEPGVRAKVIASQTASQKQKETDEQARRLAEAKRTGVTGGRRSGAPIAPALSEDDLLEQIANKHFA